MNTVAHSPFGNPLPCSVAGILMPAPIGEPLTSERRVLAELGMRTAQLVFACFATIARITSSAPPRTAAPAVQQTVYVNNPPETTLQFPGKTSLILGEHQDTNLALPEKP